MNIGDLFLQLLADGSKLTASVQKEAEKAGTVGAQTLGQKMSTGLRTNGVKAFGVAASGAFAIAAKGALELENVQAEIIAQTGMAADEAARTASVVNRVAGENRMSLLAVQDIAIAVHNDLGLVGEEADTATAKIAQFARVTHQDGAAAVAGLDDVTDAWNLTSTESLAILDQLLVSQQKFGGSIEGNLDALGKLAPQMQALGATTDDTIGLLNLFAASGIDSSKAVAALNTAVKNLKPGESLDDLVDRLAAIEDPTKRAQEAIRIFGSRGGVALANALKPGVDSLEDFAITADESAGAVGEAAEALDSTFSGRIQKAISVATASLREFGAGFGPALTGIASLSTLSASVFPGVGSKIGSQIGKGILGAKNGISWAISTAVSGVTSSSAFGAATDKIVSMFGLAGGKAGAAFSVAASAAILALPVVVTYILEQDNNAKSKARADEISKAVQDIITTGSKDGMAKAAQELETALKIEKGQHEGIGGFFHNIFGASDETAQIERDIAALSEAMGKTSMEGVATGIHENRSAVNNAFDSVIGYAAAGSLKTAQQQSHAIGAAIPEGFADGVISNRNRVGDAFSSLMSFIENFRRRGPQIAQIVGELTSKRLADALVDKRPEIRRAAAAYQQSAIAELQKLVANGEGIGKKGGAALAKALKSKNPEVRAAAQQLKNTLDGQLAKAPAAAEKRGAQTGAGFARGVRAGFGTVTLNVGISSKSVASKPGHAGGGREYRGLPRLVGERGPEVFVPNAGGYTVSRTDAIEALGGGGGGDHFTIPVSVTGVLRAETPDDIARPLRELVNSGVIRSKRRRSRIEVPTRG